MNNRIQNTNIDERVIKAPNGMLTLVLNILLGFVAIGAIIYGAMQFNYEGSRLAIGVVLFVAGLLYLCLPFPFLLSGLRIIRPNEAMVLTMFGKYHGTLRGEGFYFVNPFAVAVPPPASSSTSGELTVAEPVVQKTSGGDSTSIKLARRPTKISLKAMTLNNDKQKINDSLGNPIIIGIVVIWKVANTAKAMFNVDNYVEFLSIQCDSALRNIVRLYPYDSADDGDGGEKSLRGSSQEIAKNLQDAIQEKVEVAGLEILEARITHLAYAPEIAAAMLQRQQASAIVDARQLIVEGAVGMVEMALSRLSEHEVVELDEERKAAMVSNLMVVLCGNREAQPVVNSGSLY